MGFLSLFMMTALLLGAVMDGSAMVNAYDPFGDMIVGGVPVRDCSEFSFLVRLKMQNRFKVALCGGSIISDRHILTAAHCVEGFTSSQVTAYLGDYDRTVTEPDEEVEPISAIKRHNNYIRGSPDSDIAVLTLSSRIQFGRNRCITKIDMASSFNHDRQYCWAMGWGKLHEHDRVASNIPMKVQLPVYNMDTCKNKFSFLRPYANLNDRVLCTGDGVAAKDTCDGDSGGPIACQNHWGRYEVVGIVSTGDECAQPGWPSFNVNVATLNGWIRQQMW